MESNRRAPAGKNCGREVDRDRLMPAMSSFPNRREVYMQERLVAVICRVTALVRC